MYYFPWHSTHVSAAPDSISEDGYRGSTTRNQRVPLSQCRRSYCVCLIVQPSIFNMTSSPLVCELLPFYSWSALSDNPTKELKGKMCSWVIYTSNYFTNLLVDYIKHVWRILKFGARAENAISFTMGFHLCHRVSLKILYFTLHHIFENKTVKKKLCNFKYLGGSSFNSQTVIIYLFSSFFLE